MILNAVSTLPVVCETSLQQQLTENLSKIARISTQSTLLSTGRMNCDQKFDVVISAVKL